MQAIKRFLVSRKNLSSSEQKVLEKLVSAAELISPLYLAQKNSKYPGANFYPHDASKEELEHAAKTNPAILDPYTFVERDKNRKLIAIPYTTKFQKELKAISRLLREAASISTDKKFSSYLEARAQDLLGGNYDRSNILWLQTENSRIGFVIGAFDRYLDKNFFKKRAFMAWVGILDEKKTREIETFKDVILISEKQHLPGAKTAKIRNVKVRVEDSLLFSGLMADFMFVGNNLPSSEDMHIIKKYGTIFTLFKPTTAWRFSQWLFPIFKSIFSKKVQQEYSEAELLKAFEQTNVLHETCHTIMRYEDASGRLRELTPYFDELYTDILGIKGCGTLILKNALTERELEAILLLTVCHSLYFYTSLKTRPHLNPYATGGALILDFLLKGGALKLQKDGFHFDAHRGYMAMTQLSNIVEYYVALGNKTEAREFLGNFSPMKVFSKFGPKLRNIRGMRKRA